MPNIHDMVTLSRRELRGSFIVTSFQNCRLKNRLTALLSNLLLGLLFVSCASLDYVTGRYDQNPDQQVDVLVRVTNPKGLALTDLVLNDFYVRHNGQPLERKNRLRLRESLSTAKLYLVILVDQRENPALKTSFERTREALKAYLTIKPQNIYIKLISYDNQAKVLNEDFSNDKQALLMLLQQLNTVQTDGSGLEQALTLAKESVESLPHGSYASYSEIFDTKMTSSASESPLYDSAVLLMSHNAVKYSTVKPYSDKYNFLILDSTGSLGELPKYLTSEGDRGDNGQNGRSTIFEVYELPPSDLNKDIDQTRAVKLVTKVWDSLNNIVNGFYWLTYNKYTDFGRPVPNQVTVSLTQYGRSKDTGSLILNGDASMQAEKLLAKRNSTSAGSADLLAVKSSTPELMDLLPPSITENSSGGNGSVSDNLSVLLPAQYQDGDLLGDTLTATAVDNYPENTHLVVDEPTVDNFEILGGFPPSSEAGDDDYLVNDVDNIAPMYTAEPIPLVSAKPIIEQITNKEELKDLTNGRYIQVGAFVKLDNLYNIIERLSGDYNVRAATSTVNGREYNRCIIGPFESEKDTLDALQGLKTERALLDAFIIKQPITQWLGK